jgi:predicted transcriptional regulator
MFINTPTRINKPDMRHMVVINVFINSSAIGVFSMVGITDLKNISCNIVEE